MSFTQTLNSYSLVIALPLLFLALAMLLPVRRWRVRVPIYAGAIMVAVALFVFLRPGGSTVQSTAEAADVLASWSLTKYLSGGVGICQDGCRGRQPCLS